MNPVSEVVDVSDAGRADVVDVAAEGEARAGDWNSLSEAPCAVADGECPRSAEIVATVAGAVSDPHSIEAAAVAAAEPDALAPAIEALLFASDAPLSARKLAEFIGDGNAAIVDSAVGLLNERYAAAQLTFRIEAVAGGYQMMTLPEFQPWLARLDKHRADQRLGDAALEALAIVAYRQPIIRADVEAIRGVACGEVLHRLREMGLVRIAGRADVVGRPLLYGTTRKFLDLFGLAGLEDLPPMDGQALRRLPQAAEGVAEGEPTDPQTAR